MGRLGVVLVGSALVVGEALSATEPQGLYVMTRFMGGSLEIKSWYFHRGSFAQEPRVNTPPFDFQAAERQAPGTTGNVSRNGDQWTFRWLTGRSVTGRHEPGKGSDGCFYWDAGLFCPVSAFRAGQALDGTYSGSLGTSSVGSSRSYTFTPEGRYRMQTAGVVRSTGPTVSMQGGASSQQAGRYRLQANSMVLMPDGEVEAALTAFPYESGNDPTRPGRIYLGGFMLKRTGP